LPKDDENQGCAVQNLELQLSFQIAVLARCQFQVEDHCITIAETRQGRDLLDLARAEERARMGTRQSLNDAVCAICTSSGGQTGQFLQGLFNRPGSPWQRYSHQNGPGGCLREQTL
jgi:hypothetical protein